MTDESKGSMAPNSATGVSIVGAFIAATIVFVFHFKGVDFPAGYEALMGGAITAGILYTHKSGRRRK